MATDLYPAFGLRRNFLDLCSCKPEASFPGTGRRWGIGDNAAKYDEIARLDASATRAEMKPLDFGALVAEKAADAEFESRELNCNVQLSGDNHVYVRGNSDLLRSAVENIVRNAIRYTAPGTTVAVNLQRRNSAGLARGVLIVRDHDPGVAEPELANIFQPFYRIEDARDRQSGGMGLGLAISDRVARLHGGMVRASNATDGGLQVEFEIPAAEVIAETRCNDWRFVSQSEVGQKPASGTCAAAGSPEYRDGPESDLRTISGRRTGRSTVLRITCEMGMSQRVLL